MNCSNYLIGAGVFVYLVGVSIILAVIKIVGV